MSFAQNTDFWRVSATTHETCVGSEFGI